MRAVFAAFLLFASCTTSPATTPAAQLPANNNPIQMNRDAAASRGPVRNLAAQSGEEIVTIRYWKIRKGTFPQFLQASQTGLAALSLKLLVLIDGRTTVSEIRQRIRCRPMRSFQQQCRS